jgi:hypothetical protein
MTNLVWYCYIVNRNKWITITALCDLKFYIHYWLGYWKIAVSVNSLIFNTDKNNNISISFHFFIAEEESL